MSLTGSRAFTVIEVVLATVVLALAVTAAARASLVVAGADSDTVTRAHALEVVENESERLRAMCAAGAAEPEALARALFPHTRIDLDTDDAFFVRRSGDPDRGAFVTTTRDSDGVLRVAARFVVSAPDGWRPLPFESVDGFDGSPVRLPAATLEVDLAYVPERSERAAFVTRMVLNMDAARHSAGQP